MEYEDNCNMEKQLILSRFCFSFDCGDLFSRCDGSSSRERKNLKRYQVTPIRPIQLLLAHFLFCFTISIVSMLLLLGMLIIFFHFSYIGNWLQFIPAYLLVMVSIHVVGLIIASLSPSEKAT